MTHFNVIQQNRPSALKQIVQQVIQQVTLKPAVTSLLSVHKLRLSFGKPSALVLVLMALLSGCASTNSPAIISHVDTSPTADKQEINTMDESCIAQVRAQQAQISAPSPSQSLALANTALHCVGDTYYSPAHKDIKTAMQFSALAFVSFVNAGDMQQAAQTLASFRQKFPQQDLLFADFTSFVDTATVLVKQNQITPHQLVSLNINPTLRAEITRQRKWSLR